MRRSREPVPGCADRPGSYVLVATQSDPAGVPITVLPVRLTVS